MSIHVAVPGIWASGGGGAPAPTLSWTLRSSYGSANRALVHDGTNWVKTQGDDVYIASDPTSTWTLSPDAGYGPGYCLYYGGGYFFKPGRLASTSFVSYVSDPASTWSSVNVDGPFNEQTGYAAYYDGTYFICGGNNQRVIYSSTVGGSYSYDYVSLFNGYTVFSIYGDGTYLAAVGSAGKLSYTTSLGGTWTTGSAGFGTTQINKVHYANGYWVIVGEGGKIGYTTDITSGFTLVSSSPFDTTGINSVYYGNSMWVAVGDGGKIASCGSDPSASWALNTSPTALDLYDVVYGSDGYWVAIAYSGICCTAT